MRFHRTRILMKSRTATELFMRMAAILLALGMAFQAAPATAFAGEMPMPTLAESLAPPSEQEAAPAQAQSEPEDQAYAPYEYAPQSIALEAADTLVSPVIENGKASFYFASDADEAWIRGTLADWNPGLKMELIEEGLFGIELTLSPGRYEYKFYIPATDEWLADPLNSLEENGNSILIMPSGLASPVVNSDGTVTFSIASDAAEVYIVGSLGALNNWDAGNGIPMVSEGGIFTATVLLPPGAYEYKFLEGSTWEDKNYADPSNPNISNGNSVLYVPGLALSGPQEISDSGEETSVERYSLLLYDAYGSSSSPEALWSINGSPAGVSVNNLGEVTITWAEIEGLESFTITAAAGGESVELEVSLSEASELESPVINDDGSVTFNFESDETEAYVAGDFTNWADGKIPMRKIGGVFSLTLALTTGSHEYKFIAGESNWTLDPLNPETSGGNSVVSVPEVSIFKINYYRYNGDYDGWNIWAWAEGQNGRAYEFGEPGADGYASASIIYLGNIAQTGFIIRKGEWEERDGANDRFADANEIWILQGDEEIYLEKPVMAGEPIVYAVADSDSSVILTLAQAPSDYSSFSVYDGERKLSGASGQGNARNKVSIQLSDKISDPSKLYIAKDDEGIYSPKQVVMRGILDAFYYSGDDLGLSFSSSKSEFKVWAPTAQAVSVALYPGPGSYNAAGKVVDNETSNLAPMSKDSSGVWSASLSGDLSGQYYMYKLEFADGTINYAVDPYAKAVSANGQRTAIIDLDAAVPDRWNPDSKPSFSNPQDAVLYELHVRDFSIDENSGMENKGKFLAFTEEATTNSEGAATGISHLKALGITHVHLLPSYDFATVNELTVDDPGSSDPKFNWGYDPQNYNVPEGSYSSDPTDPAARVTEFKQMVQSLHDNGIRVVMDVVYNHTYAVDGGPFNAVVPGYYYRTTDQGGFSNGSGCGNEVASERPMVRKYIKDSVEYWAKEYGIDGFRFDLMALIDTPTMEQIVQELKSEVDSSILVYGEPWQAGGSVLDANLQTTKGSQRGKGFAVFNDHIRTAIKGGSDDASKGFATGESGQEEAIVKGVQGSVNDITDNASETINYVTAHDNYNLWDKISASYGGGTLIDPGKPLLENDAVKSVLLANGIILTAQGIPFFQAGDEMLRTKFGDHNSYASSDEINKIRWENASLYGEVFSYYAGLIELRKEHPAFRMNSKADIEKHMEILEQSGNAVSFLLKDGANGDSWENIFVAYNAGSNAKTLDLPIDSEWVATVNESSAGIEDIESVMGQVTLPPLSMTVLHTGESRGRVLASLEAQSDEIGVEVGGTKTISVIAKDSDGNAMSDVSLSFRSSDESIATVTASGRIRGVSEGTAVVEISADGVTISILVHVGALYPNSIRISGSDTVACGYSIMLSAEILDQYGQVISNLVPTWSSDAPSIASVSASGAVSGRAVGNARIRAEYGDVSEEKTIYVIEYVQRYAVLQYYRPDGNYVADSGLPWDLWVWETGSSDGAIAFEDGLFDSVLSDGTEIQVKQAYIPVGYGVSQIGCIIRKGAWGGDDREPPGDRKLNLSDKEPYTKFLVISGQDALEKSYPDAISTSELDEALFKYRDFPLFKESGLNEITSVHVNVDGKSYPMEYDSFNEYFYVLVSGLEKGVYAYTFTVLNDDEETTVTDPNNASSEIEVAGREAEPTPTPEPSPTPGEQEPEPSPTPSEQEPEPSPTPSEQEPEPSPTPGGQEPEPSPTSQTSWPSSYTPSVIMPSSLVKTKSLARLDLGMNYWGAELEGASLTAASGFVNIVKDKYSYGLSPALISSFGLAAGETLVFSAYPAAYIPAGSNLLMQARNISLASGAKAFEKLVQPIKVTVDVSDLAPAQKVNLSGFFFPVGGSPKILGGEFSDDGKEFTFYAYSTGAVGVGQPESLTKLRLAVGKLQYQLNDANLTNDVAPFISSDDRVLAPLRVIAESLGAEVSWLDSSKTAVVAKSGSQIQLKAGEALPNGMGTPVIKDDRVFVPLRYLAEMLSANVVWNEEDSSINIYQ
ncbi:MAG: type I pullulanase [Clostridiales bacterium]|nr:type I pullulanase [Clostridiales bacterium]